MHETAQLHDIPLPTPLSPAGYAAIIDRYVADVPIPYTLCGIVATHHPPKDPQCTTTGPTRVGWRLFSPRYHPGDALTDHLTFVLKYEGINLSGLSALFGKIHGTIIAEFLRSVPTGTYSRGTWFLYEWLTGNRLNLADCARGNYAPVVDPQLQYASSGRRAPR